MGEIQVDLTTREAELEQDQRRGLPFPRYFTNDLEPGKTPFDKLEWEKRTASIVDAKGETVFEQHDIEVPRSWSQTATNIVASKYFHGQLGTPERETGVRDLVGRVCNTITAGAKPAATSPTSPMSRTSASSSPT